MGDEFVHFPEVTTPVDPIEALTKGEFRKKDTVNLYPLFWVVLIAPPFRFTGAVSVATQIAGAVTREQPVFLST